MFVQCTSFRDGQIDRQYCSSVCCAQLLHCTAASDYNSSSWQCKGYMMSFFVTFMCFSNQNDMMCLNRVFGHDCSSSCFISNILLYQMYCFFCICNQKVVDEGGHDVDYGVLWFWRDYMWNKKDLEEISWRFLALSDVFVTLVVTYFSWGLNQI